MKVPLEKYESKILANRLDNYGYLFSAIRNESDSRSFYKGKARKASGIRPGIPDFFIRLKRMQCCFIELKRQRPIGKSGRLLKSPSVVSPEQINWIIELNKVPNVCAKVCFGAKEAIEFIIENEAK